MNWESLFPLIGTASISIALVVLGSLSRRIGRETRTRAYYIGLYIGAFLVALGSAAHVVALIGVRMQTEVWLLLAIGGPVAGVTLGIVVAWRYWSWLLAERG